MTANPLLVVVDDETDAREMFTKFLIRKGFRVEPAANALEAIRIVRKGGVDLVLTDFHMPEMSGLDLLREVRRMSDGLPVIVMSGQADIQTAVGVLREEAFDFLQKPVSSEELLETVRSALRRASEKTAEEVVPGRGVGPVYCTHPSGTSDVTLLEFNRPLDEHSQKGFDSAIRRLVTDGEIRNTVIIALRNVSYINNVGMNFLLTTFEDWKSKGRRIVFCQLSDPVYKYLKILGYLEYFPNALTVEDAMGIVRQK